MSVERRSARRADPDVRTAIEAIRQPSRDFRDRCNLPQRALISADVI